MPPVMELGPHVAALGMRFYTASQFPEKYRNQIFIAEHGSWNRFPPSGYRISMVQLENGEPVSYSVFAEGWLHQISAWGRPVDIEIMPDGSMLVSDDKADALYRIWYSTDH
jgi:glucose/arabinose dehydrogenase